MDKLTTTTDRILRIMACDPGLANFGWSVIDYNLTTNVKTVLKYGTITGKSLIKAQKDLLPYFEKRHLILWELEPCLIALIREYEPHYIVSEAAFSHQFPQSYAALMLVIHTLRTAAKNTIGRDIHLIAPRESKKAVSDDGTSDKLAVRDAILANPTIIIRPDRHIPLEDALSEHACDSIAAGIAFIQNQLPSVIACSV